MVIDPELDGLVAGCLPCGPRGLRERLYCGMVILRPCRHTRLFGLTRSVWPSGYSGRWNDCWVLQYEAVIQAPDATRCTVWAGNPEAICLYYMAG